MESEIDKKVNAAVVALKKDTMSLTDKVMKENYDLSQQIKELKEEIRKLKLKVDNHVDVYMDYCPHTTR
jgi:hypothetical protein